LEELTREIFLPGEFKVGLISMWRGRALPKLLALEGIRWDLGFTGDLTGGTLVGVEGAKG